MILNEVRKTPEMFSQAFTEMRDKWIGALNRPQEHFISQLLCNFNIEFDPVNVRLTFATNKAALPHPSDSRAAKAQKRKAGQNQRGGRGGRGGRRGGDGDDDDDDGGDGEVNGNEVDGRRGGGGGGGGGEGGAGNCVYDEEALLHAFETEIHLAFFLWAYCNVGHQELDNWDQWADQRSKAMVEVIDLICNGHRLLQHWFVMSARVKEYATQVERPVTSASRNFPFFLSGVETRLSLHMQELNNYRKVMLYILHKCSGRCAPLL